MLWQEELKGDDENHIQLSIEFFCHTFSLQISAMLVDVKVLRFEPRNLGLWPDDSDL